jgi:hypothetical protein
MRVSSRQPNPSAADFNLNVYIEPTNFEDPMTKPHHKLKKANHGSRPANAKARKAKRKKVRT